MPMRQHTNGSIPGALPPFFDTIEICTYHHRPGEAPLGLYSFNHSATGGVGDAQNDNISMMTLKNQSMI